MKPKPPLEVLFSFPTSIPVFFSRSGVLPGSSGKDDRKKINYIFF